MTAKTGQGDRGVGDKSAGVGHRGRTAGTGKPEQNSQSGQDNGKRTAGKTTREDSQNIQPGEDSSDKTAKTGKPGQDLHKGQLG
jgi:hypothetical protein